MRPEERRLKLSSFKDLKADTPVDDVCDLLEFGAPQDHPQGWSGWPNVNEAHVRLLDRLIELMPAYPGGFAGRGIVSCVSAKPGWSSGKHLEQGYFPGGWVLAKELRRLGCLLPITFAHLGPLEFDPFLSSLVKPLDVSVLDLRRWERTTKPWRILAGWESKVAAILASPYEEVLFLDADNTPVINPAPLFDSADYQRTGAVFWPDLPPYNRAEWLPREAWASVGLEYRDVKDIESGQLLINKRRCWRELLACRWLNEHSDRFYKVVYGDKSTFTLAWQKLGTPYTLIKQPAGWNGGCILQHDLRGQRLFEHGAQNKPTLKGYPKRGKLTHELKCIAHLSELRDRWSGRLWESFTSTLNAKLEGRRFLYRRLGLGERELRLLEDNRVGRGGARMEFGWSLVDDNGVEILAVNDVDGRPTMLLTECSDGVWRGSWLEHEKCEVELAPL